LELRYKKIHFLGDSITKGYGATVYENCCVGKITEKYPGSRITNYGVGGSCIGNCCVWGSEDMRARVAKMEPGADLIVISGGSNDFHCMTPLGTPDDRTEDSFLGAYNLLLDMLEAKFPGARLVLCTPAPRFDEAWPVRDQRVRVAPLRVYVDAVKNLATRRNLPVIDLFSIDDLHPEPQGHNKKLTVDGLHPNDEGYALIFSLVDHALQTI